MSDKKRYMLIAAALTVLLLCGCATVNVNIKKPANDEVPAEQEEAAAPAEDKAEDKVEDELADFPQLVSEDYDMSRYTDDNKMYFESHGNTWTLTDESAKKYPNLVDALKKVDEDQKKYFEDSLNEYDEEAKEFAADHGDDGTYACYSDTGLACADPKVVSLVSTTFVYFGGAHPDTTIEAYNIDAVSGQFIPLSAVIGDKKGLNEILKEALIEQYTDHDFFGLDEALEPMDMALPSFKEVEKPAYIYSFNPNGLTFYFNPTVLSPYADGGEQIDLTYEELDSVLDANFAAQLNDQ